MPENKTSPDQVHYAVQLIERIKSNDHKTLSDLYTNNFYKIETLVLKNSGTSAQAKDIYQEAFIAVWRNVKDNKFEPESDTAINGYLYTIAKNKWMDFVRSAAFNKTVSINRLSNVTSRETVPEVEKKENDREQKLTLAMKAFKDLGEACKNLLTKFYFEKKSMKEIAIDLQLDAASTRNKKYRCMQNLRQLALEKYK